MLYEYDIEMAGPSVLTDLGYISESEYLRYKKTEKKQRTIRFGCFLRDHPGLSEIYESTISEWIDRFISENDIPDYQIYERTKDSLFIGRNIPDQTLAIGQHTRFRKKKLYHEYFKITHPNLTRGVSFLLLPDESGNDSLEVRHFSSDVDFLNKFQNFLKFYLRILKSGSETPAILKSTLPVMSEYYLSHPELWPRFSPRENNGGLLDYVTVENEITSVPTKLPESALERLRLTQTGYFNWGWVTAYLRKYIF